MHSNIFSNPDAFQHSWNTNENHTIQCLYLYEKYWLFYCISSGWPITFGCHCIVVFRARTFRLDTIESKSKGGCSLESSIHVTNFNIRFHIDYQHVWRTTLLFNMSLAVRTEAASHSCDIRCARRRRSTRWRHPKRHGAGLYRICIQQAAVTRLPSPGSHRYEHILRTAMRWMKEDGKKRSESVQIEFDIERTIARVASCQCRRDGSSGASLRLSQRH